MLLSMSFLDLISANQMAISKLKDSRILSVLKGCDGLIRDSIRLPKKSITTMGVDPDDKIFKMASSVRDLKKWTSNASQNMDRCLNALENDHEGLKIGKLEFLKLKMKILNARDYLENSSVILAKMDTILGMFNQAIFIDYYFLLGRLRYDVESKIQPGN
ncbi:hypothetical protein ACH5RR_025919 [Cinchona calisaya]|uniref:Uncharacterized protein n=1 Tax=Cinchona calisaya TaxID=153742 RepID=A0ABD2Z486_9GENT